MSAGQLLKYGYHKKASEEHVDFGTISINRWITGIGLVLSERKVKQTKAERALYAALQKFSTKVYAPPGEFNTLYTVLLADGSKREFGPASIVELL